ncbi:MAG: glutaredoxin family protein [Burkholderiales bacterium]|nr:glutaredoxin family protein [Burkholderiales bacterium]
MHRHPDSRTACWLAAVSAFAALAGLTLVGPAAAQYKVVNPDGTVTYTDRPPPPSSNARVTQLGRGSAAAAPDAALPTALRQALQRYPVTLYAATECSACDAARQYLQQRGVPYSERRVASDDDIAALERIAGARTVPALTIGAQTLRGYSQSDWAAYLDAAGYPRESQLPRGWQPPPPTPVVAERTAPARAAAPASAPAQAATESAPEANPAGVRF